MFIKNILKTNYNSDLIKYNDEINNSNNNLSKPKENLVYSECQWDYGTFKKYFQMTILTIYSGRISSKT